MVSEVESTQYDNSIVTLSGFEVLPKEYQILKTHHMKKIIILSPLVLFLFACEKSNPAETHNLSQQVAAPKNNFVDSMDIWTRNIQENYQAKVEKTNYTDKNNLKQGKWIIMEIGELKTVFYKDGKIMEGC